jgi:hypothetical protein
MCLVLRQLVFLPVGSTLSMQCVLHHLTAASIAGNLMQAAASTLYVWDCSCLPSVPYW